MELKIPSSLVVQFLDQSKAEIELSATIAALITL